MGADVRVVLVLDLQNVGVQLHPFAVHVRTDLNIRRVGRAHGLAQAVGVAGQVVVARREAGLGVALVAQVAHAQAGGIGQEQGFGVQLFELVRAATQEAFVQRRRGAEQVHQQPAVAAEVADQRDVGRRLVVAVV